MKLTYTSCFIIFGTSKNASPRVDKIGVGRIRNINKYEYLFGQKRINAENVKNNFMYILILLLFLFIITYEFRRTFFWGVGGWERTELFFLKMYLVFY